MSNNTLALENRLEEIEGLPTLPLVLRQIQKVMNNERTSMTQIAAVVAKDQALTSRAIRLVNSAWYGRTTRVTSIQQVLVTLGLKALNSLMLGLTITKMFGSSNGCGFDGKAFWEHSFGTALLARKLAKELKSGCDAEECFIAGLLHDMGRLVLEQYFHDDFMATMKRMRETGQSLLTAEKNIFGFSHTDAGAWLGRKWNIPQGLTLAMEFHHTSVVPLDLHPNEKHTVNIVSAANELCLAGNIGSSGEHAPSTVASHFRNGWSAELCTRLVNETRQEVTATIQQWSA